MDKIQAPWTKNHDDMDDVVEEDVVVESRWMGLCSLNFLSKLIMCLQFHIVTWYLNKGTIGWWVFSKGIGWILIGAESGPRPRLLTDGPGHFWILDKYHSCRKYSAILTSDNSNFHWGAFWTIRWLRAVHIRTINNVNQLSGFTFYLDIIVKMYSF